MSTQTAPKGLSATLTKVMATNTLDLSAPVSQADIEAFIKASVAEQVAQALAQKPAKTVKTTAKSAKTVTKMTAKREAVIGARLTALWHERVKSRKTIGEIAWWDSEAGTEWHALKAELKAAGKSTKVAW
jgi:hypothetical protein